MFGYLSTWAFLAVALFPAWAFAGQMAGSNSAPDVVVDLSGVSEPDDPGPELRPAPPPVAPAGSQLSERLASPLVADPLKQPIGESAASTSKTWNLTGFGQWTQQPIPAALLSLGIVLAGYGLWRAVVGRGISARPGQLPRQVVELVGFVPLGPRQQLQLVRLGSKLVLVAVAHQRMDPLAEVTDPVEVDQILAACRSGQSALAGAISRWSGRQRTRESSRTGGSISRAVFEA
jgi:flagellar biogenesis protein FliO